MLNKPLSESESEFLFGVWFIYQYQGTNYLDGQTNPDGHG